MKNKTLIVGIIVVVIALVAFVLFKNNSNAPAQQTSATQQESVSAVDAPTSDAALSQLEKENNAEDFSSLDADLGAEVNSAAQ